MVRNPWLKRPVYRPTILEPPTESYLQYRGTYVDVFDFCFCSERCRSNIFAAPDSFSLRRVRDVTFIANGLQVSVPVLKIGRSLGQQIGNSVEEAENSILCPVKASELLQTRNTSGQECVHFFGTKTAVALWHFLQPVELLRFYGF